MMSKAFGWQDQGLAIDVAVHFGTLLAILIYFAEYVKQGLKGGFDLVTRQKSEDLEFAF